MKKLIERTAVKVPLNPNSDSIWRAKFIEKKFLISGALALILYLLCLFSEEISIQFYKFLQENTPILYKTLADGETVINSDAYTIFFLVLLVFASTSAYFISVFMRLIFREELRKRAEKEKKKKFRAAIKEITRYGECFSREASKLARTKAEKKAVRDAITKYRVKEFRNDHIFPIADGDVSKRRIKRAETFLKRKGISSKELEILLIRAVKVGAKINALKQKEKDLFRWQD